MDEGLQAIKHSAGRQRFPTVLHGRRSTVVYRPKRRRNFTQISDGGRPTCGSNLPHICVFRAKLDTHSTANWTRIPRQTGHPVQRKLDTDSAPNWTV